MARPLNIYQHEGFSAGSWHRSIVSSKCWRRLFAHQARSSQSVLCKPSPAETDYSSLPPRTAPKFEGEPRTNGPHIAAECALGAFCHTSCRRAMRPLPLVQNAAQLARRVCSARRRNLSNQPSDDTAQSKFKTCSQQRWQQTALSDWTEAATAACICLTLMPA